MKVYPILILLTLGLYGCHGTASNKSVESHFYEKFDWFTLTGINEITDTSSSLAYPYIKVESYKGGICSFTAFPNENREIKFELEKKNKIVYSLKKTPNSSNVIHAVNTYTIFLEDSIITLEYYPKRQNRGEKQNLSSITVLCKNFEHHFRFSEKLPWPSPKENSFSLKSLPFGQPIKHRIEKKWSLDSDQQLVSETVWYYPNETGDETPSDAQDQCYQLPEPTDFFWWTLAPQKFEIEDCP